jgi:hypothetical protein
VDSRVVERAVPFAQLKREQVGGGGPQFAGQVRRGQLRNDNCVKNHFYSKLRKSLRTINKIAKLHLNKEVKEISDVVIYKLTEATDDALKANSETSKEVAAMCYGTSLQHCVDLKNKLLEYEMDQKNIKENLDYRSEKELLQGLALFNKVYKKKAKKEKVSLLGSENLRKKTHKNTINNVPQTGYSTKNRMKPLKV